MRGIWMNLLLRGVEIIKGTCLRIPPNERIPELHYYDIRADDESNGIPCTLERFVFINHFGTIATAQPLPLDEDGQLLLTEEEQAVIYESI